jgi:hypothetical protein
MNAADSRPIVTVKLGGSLLDWPGLPGRLVRYLAERSNCRVVLVVGGGPFAEAVRDLDRIHDLGSTVAHLLALRSLEVTAHVIAALVPALEVVEHPPLLAETWTRRHTPVFAPRWFMNEIDDRSADPLPRTWETTSDSIAARLAVYLGAEELVLLKSAPLPPATDRAGAARLGLVDPNFPRAARGVERVHYLNFRDPEARPQLLPDTKT